MTTLALRNLNPGNLRKSDIHWQGQVGTNSGFCVFDTMVNGVRALAMNLITYEERYGIDTITKAIDRWAPGNENNTAAYIAFVCTVTGLQPDDKLDFRDPTGNTLFWFVTAIGEEESGVDEFTHGVTDDEIDTGVKDALAAK